MVFCAFFLSLWYAPTKISAQIPAFPGAEGFGTLTTTGGRGGTVYYVTNLNCSGPGSLNDALAQQGPRYILFAVSGVIECAAEVIWGDCYIAGQTSPGGIIVRGLILDDFYTPTGKARNVIVRHVNSRPGLEGLRPGKGWVLDDALRLDGARDVVIDHCSFANAIDECVQISRSSRVTMSNCMLAETLGGHFDLGGMLLNYSTADHPKDSISLHHNLWNRIGGRMPEISCEESAEKPGDQTCLTRPFRLEYSNNLLWDPNINVYYGAGFSPSNTTAYHDIFANFIGNHAIARNSYCGPFFNFDLLQNKENQFFVSGNTMARYPAFADYQLFYCCNDFCRYSPNTEMGNAQRRDFRHPFPSINYIPAAQLREYMANNVGAFNPYSTGRRDPMNRRLLAPVRANAIDIKPVDGKDYYQDAFALDYTAPPPAPVDSDKDGIPDDWERTYGLNPNQPDHNGLQLSLLFTGIAGYTNLECYLNDRSNALVNGQVTSLQNICPFAGSSGHCPDAPLAYLGPENLLIIQFPETVSDRYDAQVIDLGGRIVHRFSITGGTGQSSLQHLPRGIYALQLTGRQRVFSGKIAVP